MNAAGTIRMSNRPMSLGPPLLSVMTGALAFGLELFVDMTKSLRSAGMDKKSGNDDYTRTGPLVCKLFFQS
jgi:hypothetical protein